MLDSKQKYILVLTLWVLLCSYYACYGIVKINSALVLDCTLISVDECIYKDDSIWYTKDYSTWYRPACISDGKVSINGTIHQTEIIKYLAGFDSGCDNVDNVNNVNNVNNNYYCWTLNGNIKISKISQDNASLLFAASVITIGGLGMLILSVIKKYYK